MGQMAKVGKRAEKGRRQRNRVQSRAEGRPKGRGTSGADGRVRQIEVWGRWQSGLKGRIWGR